MSLWEEAKPDNWFRSLPTDPAGKREGDRLGGDSTRQLGHNFTSMSLNDKYVYYALLIPGDSEKESFMKAKPHWAVETSVGLGQTLTS